MILTLRKRADGLVVCIPKSVARNAGLNEGSQVELLIERDRVVLTPAKVPSLRRLLARIKPGSRPQLIDWGKPLGRELW